MFHTEPSLTDGLGEYEGILIFIYIVSIGTPLKKSGRMQPVLWPLRLPDRSHA